MQNDVMYTIDDLIPLGQVRMSAATAKVLLGDEKGEGELKRHGSGHHVGEVALIHVNRAAVNDRLQAEEAHQRYKAENHGVEHPDALGYYRARGRFLPGHFPAKKDAEAAPEKDAQGDAK